MMPKIWEQCINFSLQSTQKGTRQHPNQSPIKHRPPAMSHVKTPDWYLTLAYTFFYFKKKLLMRNFIKYHRTMLDLGLLESLTRGYGNRTKNFTIN
ncbi:hypothetical protein BpHYR1_022673 [Brachionus plicatilis]|uniref:Uncharacterized protein n=1 Tax=Brachionus plicatilis TaxID=10195 RepID=A0A3M7SJ77_BRAPC|nr:hypothetical protein BpHYR1_022673 [Brachionus plicatilis]